MVFGAVVDAKETSKKKIETFTKNIREKGHTEHNCNIKFSLSPGNSKDKIQKYNDQRYKTLFLLLKLVIGTRQYIPFRMASVI